MSIRRKDNTVRVYTSHNSRSLNSNELQHTIQNSSPTANKIFRLRNHLNPRLTTNRRPENPKNTNIFNLTTACQFEKDTKKENSHNQTDVRSHSVKRCITSEFLSNLLENHKSNLPIIDNKDSRPFSALTSGGFMVKNYRKRNTNSLLHHKNEFKFSLLDNRVLCDINNKIDLESKTARIYKTFEKPRLKHKKSKLIKLIPFDKEFEENLQKIIGFSPERSKYTYDSDSPSPTYAPRYQN